MKEYGLARKAAGKTKIDARRAAATVHGMSEYEPHPEDAALYDPANVNLQTRHRGVPYGWEDMPEDIKEKISKKIADDLQEKKRKADEHEWVKRGLRPRPGGAAEAAAAQEALAASMEDQINGASDSDSDGETAMSRGMRRYRLTRSEEVQDAELKNHSRRMGVDLPFKGVPNAYAID